MFGIVKGIGCEPVQVGGMGDHVHILLGLSRTLTIADTVKTIKTSSTGWLKDERNIARFAWQTGYAIASVNAGDSGDVVRYIQNQEEHHQKVDFKAEYRKFLDDNGIEYNDLYIWD
jgi:REP element-mobilizing transposase RayT